MFGKLLKYEFKATYKWYLILFAVLAALSILMGITAASTTTPSHLQSNYDSSTSVYWALYGFLMLLLVSAGSGVYLSNMIITIVRFYKNIFGREGYLTWTLPVTTHQVLLAKLLTAITWSLLCTISLGLSFSCLLFTASTISHANIFDILDFFKNMDVAYILLYLVRQFLQLVSGILFLYLAMSIGHLFKNNRILMSILFAFLLWIILGSISLFIPNGGFFGWFNELYYNFLGRSVLKSFIFSFAYIYEIIKIIGFYFAVYFICKYKLNLQ